MFNKKTISITEIFILVIGIIAIAYVLGSEVKVVSAEQIFPSQGDLIGPGSTCSGQKIITCSQGQTINCDSGKQECVNTPTTCTGQPPNCNSGQTATCSNGKYTCTGTQTQASCTGSIPTCPPGQTATCNSGSSKYTCDGKPADESSPSGAAAPPTSSVVPMAGYYLFNHFFLTKAGATATGTAGATAGTTATEGAKVACTKLLCRPFFKAAGQIIENFAVAELIKYGIKFIGPFLHLNKSAIDSASKAAFIGYFAYSSANTLFGTKEIIGEGGKKIIVNGPLRQLVGSKIAGILTNPFFGIGLAVAIFVLTYKKSQEQNIAFQCLPWQAPLGGANCEQCNKGPFPCTEYQCKSLGQGCEIINQGTLQELCVWKNRKDTKPPVIQPWQDALSDSKLSYKPDGKTSPPDRGVFVTYNNKCIPAFMPFSFGITLDEPAICKADTVRKKTFDEMPLYFGGSNTASYNFTQTISLPSNESLAAENLTLQNDGNFEIYVRCVDVNGNPVTSSPSSSFVFKYCVDKGPDTQAPIILGTNPVTLPDGVPIGFNQSSIKMDVYVNEPSECKWAHDRDLDFSQMEGNMSCSSSVFEMNAQMLYKCSTTLTGLKNQIKNDFYFRCKDKPKSAEKDRNVMSKGYKFTIQGTQPLIIDEIAPNGTIKDSTSPAKITLKVQTSAGYKEGDATCYYSESCWEKTGRKDKYTMFYYSQGTSSYSHSQDLWIEQGSYQCSIRCVDLGGNTDTKEVSYKIEIDDRSPQIVRAYHESNYLKIITDENATCVYGTNSCSYLFGDGIVMDTLNGNEHFTDWNADNTYYIRCKDSYGNEPFANQCSIIVRPFELFKRGQ
ncbi:hypothetical protein HY212_01950 [Candidatus Pacearchaeota archaeon]|nr:hypothetical protein [Candidatus Pacearchaeota archaeon]